jgi:hypothetical protein
VKILDGNAGWYPQVLGEVRRVGQGGNLSRLYIYGVSEWEMVTVPDSQPQILTVVP